MKDKIAKGLKFVGAFPEVELEEGEKIEVEVRRSRKGVILIWVGEAVGLVLLSIGFLVLSGMGGQILLPMNESAMGYFYLLVFMMYVVLIFAGWIATVVYRANYLTVTNKRAIQRTTTSLFARSFNVIELASVEDVSFSEKNIFDRLLKMGTVRMSTVGDETTYILSHVDAGVSGVSKIVKLVHGAKAKRNGVKGKANKDDENVGAEGVLWSRHEDGDVDKKAKA